MNDPWTWLKVWKRLWEFGMGQANEGKGGTIRTNVIE